MCGLGWLFQELLWILCKSHFNRVKSWKWNFDYFDPQKLCRSMKIVTCIFRGSYKLRVPIKWGKRVERVPIKWGKRVENILWCHRRIPKKNTYNLYRLGKCQLVWVSISMVSGSKKKINAIISLSSSLRIFHIKCLIRFRVDWIRYELLHCNGSSK